MRIKVNVIARSVAAALLVVLPATASSIEPARFVARDLAWRQSGDATLQVDNDLLSLSGEDRDYTGGFSLTLPRPGAPGRRSPERWMHALVGHVSDGPSQRALQLQVIAFSPGDLEADRVIENDRPYASLWAVTSASQRVSPDERSATFASITIGVIGLPFAEDVHRAVHRASSSPIPRGYGNQISDGGEPTAKLTVANRHLVSGGGIHRGTDLWVTYAASVGYLTEISISAAYRLGQRGTPWWSSGGGLFDYGPAPALRVDSRGLDSHVELGVGLRARAYNAFLQGQFRHSAQRLGWSQLEPVLVDAWVGAVADSGTWRLEYRLIARSGELRTGPASHPQVWGSIALSFGR
jgi:hypothetical protein